MSAGIRSPCVRGRRPAARSHYGDDPPCEQDASLAAVEACVPPGLSTIAPGRRYDGDGLLATDGDRHAPGRPERTAPRPPFRAFSRLRVRRDRVRHSLPRTDM